MENYIPPTGANPSATDIRTFSYPVAEAAYIQKAGKRYGPQDIEHQHNVGICTAISLTQNARKATGVRFSADFQYLLQKRYVDGNWSEGSSIFSALKVAKTYGLLPEAEFSKWITEADRSLPYTEYVKKLQAVPTQEIVRLLAIAAQHKIVAYETVPVTRDTLAKAISESKAGILCRYEVGNEWWTDKNGNVTWNKAAIEPLRPPKVVVSGHAITDSNCDGGSFRVANTWGGTWADGGTAYRLHASYRPTEAWKVYFKNETVPARVSEQLDSRTTVRGKLNDMIQKFVSLFQ